MNAKTHKEIDWRLRVFESLSFPSLVMTPDKIIVAGNQVFLDKYDTTLERIVGKTCHEVFYGTRHCPNEKCALPKVMAERRGQNILHSVTTRTGKKYGRIDSLYRLSVKMVKWTTFLKACVTLPG